MKKYIICLLASTSILSASNPEHDPISPDGSSQRPPAEIIDQDVAGSAGGTEIARNPFYDQAAFNEALATAAATGNEKEVHTLLNDKEVHALLTAGSEREAAIDFKLAFNSACFNNHVSIADQLFVIGNLDQEALNNAFARYLWNFKTTSLYTVEYLLQKGGDANIRIGKNNIRSPLDIAVINENMDLAVLLISYESKLVCFKEEESTVKTIRFSALNDEQKAFLAEARALADHEDFDPN